MIVTTTPRGLVLAAILILGGWISWWMVAWTQASPPDQPQALAPSEPESSSVRRAEPPEGFPDLVAGLRASPGCLGVEVARTGSGKNVIFAWFENKQAVLRWYHSAMHQQVMRQFTDGPYGRPLRHVTDEATPILVIASLTLTDQPRFEGLRLPVSQIAIEMYQPVPGGAAMGGRFAPSGLKVPGLREYDPDDEGAGTDEDPAARAEDGRP